MLQRLSAVSGGVTSTHVLRAYAGVLESAHPLPKLVAELISDGTS